MFSITWNKIWEMGRLLPLSSRMPISPRLGRDVTTANFEDIDIDMNYIIRKDDWYRQSPVKTKFWNHRNHPFQNKTILAKFLDLWIWLVFDESEWPISWFFCICFGGVPLIGYFDVLVVVFAMWYCAFEHKYILFLYFWLPSYQTIHTNNHVPDHSDHHKPENQHSHFSSLFPDLV